MALRRLDRDLAGSLGLPESHWHALLALTEEGPLTVTGLGEVLHLEKSTASRLADALAADGLVRKRPSFIDGRSVVLQLTEKGMPKVRKGLNARTEMWMEVLGGVQWEEPGSDPDELASALRGLLLALTER